MCIKSSHLYKMKLRIHWYILLIVFCFDCIILSWNSDLINRNVDNLVTLSPENNTIKYESYAGGTNLLNLQFASDTSNETLTNVSDQKMILLFNIPKHVIVSTKQRRKYNVMCRYQNCKFTQNRNMLLSAHAVVFQVGVRNEKMGDEPPINSKVRRKEQVWIFSSEESPDSYFNADYQLDTWSNTMNWSLSYRTDSDILNPYGSLISKTDLEQKDYESIYTMKTKNALWLVRQCQTSSARRQYVNAMIQNGFEVDILGICGTDGKEIPPDELENIIPKYKFYLGFEACLCNDYITERFFSNYNYDWILVVRGGADYNRLIPTNTYVNTADFSNIPSLVKFLQELGNDKEKYIEFLQNKDMFESRIFDKSLSRCEICTRLNNLEMYRNSYMNISSYFKYQCKLPSDL